MNRILKGVYIISFTFIGILLLHCLVTNPRDIKWVYRENPDLISAILMIATCSVCMLMVGRLVLVHRKKKRNPLVVELLISIFLFLGLTLLLEGVFSIIRVTPRQLNLVGSQSVFFFLAAAGFLLTQFQIEVFSGGMSDKRNKVWLIIVGFIALTLDVGIMKDTLFGSEVWELTIIGAPAIFVLYYLFITLAISSLRTSKKVEDPIAKQGFKLMGWGWSVIFIGFLFLIIGGFFDFQNFIEPILFITLSIMTFAIVFIGTTLLYIGFIFPMKEKNQKV